MPTVGLKSTDTLILFPLSSHHHYHHMPKSKSKSNARVVRSGGMPAHPGMLQPNKLLAARMGSIESLRLPDHFNSPTAATVLHAVYDIASDAAGNAVWVETPNLDQAPLKYTVTAGAVGTGANNAHPQKVSFQNEARYARMVHMQIQVEYVGAVLEAAGYLSTAFKVSTSDVDNATVTALHTHADRMVKATDGAIVDNSFVHQPDMKIANAGGWMEPEFQSVMFAASGLPASKTVFRVRVLRFVEFEPKEGVLSEGTQQSEPHDPAALAVHGQLSHPSFSIRTAVDKGLGLLKQAATASYHIVQPMAQQYITHQARSWLADAMATSLPLLTM